MPPIALPITIVAIKETIGSTGAISQRLIPRLNATPSANGRTTIHVMCQGLGGISSLTVAKVTSEVRSATNAICAKYRRCSMKLVVTSIQRSSRQSRMSASGAEAEQQRLGWNIVKAAAILIRWISPALFRSRSRP
jgi:hypothetical protein